MLLLTFSTLLLISSSYGQDNTTLATGIVDNPLGYTAIIALPSACKYSLQSATLNIGGNATQATPFTMPQCRLRRDLIIVNDSQNGNVATVNVGYQVVGLQPNLTYTAWYTINGADFNKVTFATKTVLLAPPSDFRRSGGMVVITVILSIAMFLLVVGLIVVLVLSGRGKK
ncbi:uroplakin-2 [Anomaloglossus baeobatrachus]|uniref:uroplakin-2 n=1 Tax=Anomaloglossus baeobatrachus TaxID=238106 RepID=UPI003F506E61